jgi:hypothetical protein
VSLPGFVGQSGPHSLLPAAFRGACSPWSPRCSCGNPKPAIASACAPCRLRRAADAEAERARRAEIFAYWAEQARQPQEVNP